MRIELADPVDVVRIDEIGNRPAVEVVLSETLVREATIGFRKACGFLCRKYFGTDGFVIAAIVALVEFVAAAELGADGIPEQLHYLDPINGIVAIRATNVSVEVGTDVRILEIGRVRV